MPYEMTERKRNWLTWIFSILAPIIVSGIFYGVLYLGILQAAKENQERVNSQVQTQLEKLEQKKADMELFKEVNQRNQQDHSEIKQDLKSIQKDLNEALQKKH